MAHNYQTCTAAHDIAMGDRGYLVSRIDLRSGHRNESPIWFSSWQHPDKHVARASGAWLVWND